MAMEVTPSSASKGPTAEAPLTDGSRTSPWGSPCTGTEATLSPGCPRTDRIRGVPSGPSCLRAFPVMTLLGDSPWVRRDFLRTVLV